MKVPARLIVTAFLHRAHEEQFGDVSRLADKLASRTSDGHLAYHNAAKAVVTVSSDFRRP
jgi:hypothetical protein